MPEIAPLPADYAAWLAELKTRIHQARQRAALAVNRELVLYDTSVISEYLDERYPHPPLMPVDPLSRARLRLAMVRLENDWLTLVDQIEEGGKGAEPARKALRAELISNAPAFILIFVFVGNIVPLEFVVHDFVFCVTCVNP